MENRTSGETPPALEIQGGEHRWSTTDVTSKGWTAVFRCCEEATRRIVIEQFIFGHHGVGARLLDLLSRKAREGVAVRVIADAIGSPGFLESDALRRFLAAGGQAAVYDPNRRFPYWPRLLPRDHRKLVAVDGEIAFLGGICFADRMEDWHDLLVQIAGPVAVDVERGFDEIWADLRDEEPAGPLARAWDGNGFGYLRGQGEHGILQKTIRHALERAQRRILLTTPYFLPRGNTLRLLRRAALRGVAVDILLPAKSDHRWADFAGRGSLGAVVKAGARVWLYPDMLHTKLLVADGTTCLGSMNYDLLSLETNLENGLISTDPDFVAEMCGYFRRRTGEGRAVDRNNWTGELRLSERVAAEVLSFFRRPSRDVSPSGPRKGVSPGDVIQPCADRA